MQHSAMDEGDLREEWLSLQEASELLGVATSTLRRWGDTGKLPMRRTLGGHRRFPKLAVQRFAAARAGARITMAPTAGTAALDTHEMQRAAWHARLAGRSDPDRMRGLGQRLLGLLLQYITRHEDDQRFLNEARMVGATYGSETRVAGVSLHDTVEAFLFFRASFSRLAHPLPGITQPTDLDQAAALRERIDRFMDAVLLGAIAGYAAQE